MIYLKKISKKQQARQMAPKTNRNTNLIVLIHIVFYIAHTLSVVTTMSTIPPTTKTTSNPRLAAILFDIDGTLVHSDPIHFRVFQELLLQVDGFNNNNPIDLDYFRKHISGGNNGMIMEHLFPNWSIQQRESWSYNKERRFRELAQQSMKQLQMSGLDKLREWINSNNIQKAAVTNAPKLNAKAILQGIKYDDWFHDDIVILGEECEKPKPYPDPYLVACKKLNVSPKDCLVLEDSPSGVKAGIAAGAVVIGISSGQTEQTLLDVGCHMVIQDFDDPKLWQYLESCELVTTTTTTVV